MPDPLVPLVPRVFGRLPDPTLPVPSEVPFVANLVPPDPVPFVDGMLLGLLTSVPAGVP